MGADLVWLQRELEMIPAEHQGPLVDLIHYYRLGLQHESNGAKTRSIRTVYRNIKPGRTPEQCEKRLRSVSGSSRTPGKLRPVLKDRGAGDDLLQDGQPFVQGLLRDVQRGDHA